MLVQRTRRLAYLVDAGPLECQQAACQQQLAHKHDGPRCHGPAPHTATPWRAAARTRRGPRGEHGPSAKQQDGSSQIATQPPPHSPERNTHHRLAKQVDDGHQGGGVERPACRQPGRGRGAGRRLSRCRLAEHARTNAS